MAQHRANRFKYAHEMYNLRKKDWIHIRVHRQQQKKQQQIEIVLLI